MAKTPAPMTFVTDPAKIVQSVYSDEAQVYKGAEAGLNLKPLGPINAATRVDKATPLLIYNDAASIAYVICGPDKTVAAPSSPATGIPVQPKSSIMLNSGMDEYVIASAATVYAYAPEQYEPDPEA